MKHQSISADLAHIDRIDMILNRATPRPALCEQLQSPYLGRRANIRAAIYGLIIGAFVAWLSTEAVIALHAIQLAAPSAHFAG